MAELTASGARIVGYGAAAKANTLLNYCPDVARSLQLILDLSPHKQGLYTPGTHIRVAPLEGWQPGPTTHMLILAWNFQHEIMRGIELRSRPAEAVYRGPIPSRTLSEKASGEGGE